MWGLPFSERRNSRPALSRKLAMHETPPRNRVPDTCRQCVCRVIAPGTKENAWRKRKAGEEENINDLHVKTKRSALERKECGTYRAVQASRRELVSKPAISLKISWVGYRRRVTRTLLRAPSECVLLVIDGNGQESSA